MVVHGQLDSLKLLVRSISVVLVQLACLVSLHLVMAHFLKLISIIALVSFEQGILMYVLVTKPHLAHEIQLSRFPIQAGQLASSTVTVCYFC